jgi:hypothetical protein
MVVVATNEVFRCGCDCCCCDSDDADAADEEEEAEEGDDEDERLFSTHRTLVDTLAASNSLSKLPK